MELKTLIIAIALLSPFRLFSTCTTIDFKLVDRLVVFEATIGGLAGHYILDTGIPHILLNKRYFQGKPSGLIHFGILGKAEDMQKAFLPITLGAITWKSMYAGIVQLDHLARSLKVPIHGLIGCSLFRGYEIKIDYEAKKIILWSIDRKGERDNGSGWEVNPDAILPFHFRNGIPILDLSISSRDYAVILDTGAEINLLQRTLIDDHKNNLEVTGHAAIGGIGTQVLTSPIALIHEVKVGAIECRPMRTGFIDMSFINNQLPVGKAVGIIGYEFLRQFKFAFNFKKNELYLWYCNDSSREIATAGE